MKKIFSLILIVVCLFCGCEDKAKTNLNNSETNNENLVGVWINYNEINFLINKCETENQLNTEICSMLEKFLEFKINTIFLHCRAFDDCFYVSKIYQPSKYCLNADNCLKFDILQAFIDCANNYGIEIHAWLNPYRIRNDSNFSLINEKSHAGKWHQKNPLDERLIITENSIFYNPSSIDVQKYILDGIKEILINYNVDGIHIDDYFYPTTNKNIDVGIYEKYIKNGGKLSLEDYRRNNVNTLIASIYSLVKSYNSKICFSISPSADIYTNYNLHYADVELWATQKGFVDYIIPQIYFGFKHETMPFESVVNDWINLKTDNTKIAIGVSIYKSGEVDVYAKSGCNEWIDYSDVLKRQISLINSNDLISGYVFYSSSYILNDYNDNLKQEKINIIS